MLLTRIDSNEIYFDPKSTRWRYRDSKAFAPMEAVRSLAAKYRDSQRLELVRVGVEYGYGSLSLTQAQKKSAEILKSIHLAEMITALDKQSDLKGADLFLLVARNLKKQYYSGIDPISKERFGLNRLWAEVASGTSKKSLESRLAAFGRSSKETYWGTKTELGKLKGLKMARRVLGNAEHCPECREYASRGWEAIANTILPSVACRCGTNCKCTLVYK